MAHIKKNFWEGSIYVRCPNCGYKGKGKYVCPGSLLMELFLWLMVIPGFFYSRWRSKNSGYVCKDCRNQNVVKISKNDALKEDVGTTTQKIEVLEKLGNLKEKGVISEEEFALKKKELMG